MSNLFVAPGWKKEYYKLNAITQLPIMDEDSFGLVRKVFRASNSLIFYGYARENALPSEAKWQILQVITTDAGRVDTKAYANGNPGFVHVWDDKLTYPYGTQTEATFFNFNSMSFNGIDEYMEIPVTSAMNWSVNNAYSVSFWAKANTVANAGFVSQWSSNTSIRVFEIVLSASTNSFAYVFGNSSGGYTILEQDLIFADQWNHFVVTNNQNEYAMYFNGTELQRINRAPNIGTSINNSSLPVRVGNTRSANTLLNGFIDEVVMWNVAIDQAEVTALYNGGVPGSPEGLTYSNDIACWLRMGDNLDSSTMGDASGNGSDATLINMTTGNKSSDIPTG